MKWFRLMGLTVALFLSGCVTTNNNDSTSTGWVYPPMAVPLQVSIEQEVQVARLSQLLQRSDLSDEIRAKIFYERGSHYDSMGLRDLARLDFNRSLELEPAQPDIFNLLGVYYTQVGEFDAGYEAFDSTLELDPENLYAARNKAIALYYGGRTELAFEQMTAHYQAQPEDPFRALWLYIIEYDINAITAEANLRNRYNQKSEDWGWFLVGIMLNEVTEEQVFKAVLSGTRDNVVLAQRLTEAYFYLGKRYQFVGRYADAISLYKLALSFNVYEYVEHRYSFLELGRIYSDIRQQRTEEVIEKASL